MNMDDPNTADLHEAPPSTEVPTPRNLPEAKSWNHLAIFDEFLEGLPEEAFDDLPEDGAINHDHYLNRKT